ncbi:MAG: hypothetical protein ACYS0I_18615 [Planctomycetota bacterium]|jgi:hypothetical protein
MKATVYLKTLLITGIYFLIIGCGITGTTVPFTLELSNPSPDRLTAAPKVDTVELGEEASLLIPVGVFAMGKFDSNDLAVIGNSLKNTLATVKTNEFTEPIDELNLHLVIRRYLVAASNVEVTALACVAWCAINQHGKIVFHEQFYASKAGRGTTLGAIKMAVHRGIVSRIAETAVVLASSSGETAIAPAMPENTYNSFEEAVRGMPKQLTSYYFGAFNLGSAYYISHGRTSSQDVNTDWAREPYHINWENYLTREKTVN